MKKKIASLAITSALLFGAMATSASAASVDNGIKLNLNGSYVSDPLVTNMNGYVYVSVEIFAKYYNVKVDYDQSTKVLKLNDTVVSNTYGEWHEFKGTLTAPIRALAEAIGGNHFEIGWDAAATTVNLAILPADTIKLTPVVPQMGEHWANPKDMPLGPIYGVYNGKLVFLEYMPAKDLDKTVHDVPGTLVPISSKIDHFDIDWNPHGHEGYEVPHYDMHLYFISRAEQNQIGAMSDDTAPSLVALGDSITFGYNLDPANKQPSTSAYPYLMGNVLHEGVADLGQPGWTSTDLLNALSTSNLQNVIKNAKLITIDIGSNDILQLAQKAGLLAPTNTNPSLTDAQKKEFSDAIQQFGVNLTKILDTLKKEAPNATIEVINLYNPIPTSNAPLHALGNQFVQAMNTLIKAATTQYKIPVADAYTAIEGKQSDLILPGDVHPNIQGQQAIAQAAEAALQAVSTQGMDMMQGMDMTQGK